jgi:CubicO group peptidase (beta-lactamase class C family)
MRGLAYPTTDSPRITIRHLLSHAEGFPEDNPWGDRQLADSDEQLSQMIKGGIPFSNAPGIAYEYSNYGFAILGRIVSNVSDEKYTDFVTANILKPLGMTSTICFSDDSVEVTPLVPAPPAPAAARHGSFGAMGGMLTW